MEPERPALAPPPESLRPVGGVDGWEVRVPNPEAPLASPQDLTVGVGFVGVGFNVLAVALLGPLLWSLGPMFALLGVAALVVLDAVVVLGLVRTLLLAGAPRIRLQSTHMVVERPRSTPQRIPWSQVFAAERTDTGGTRIRWTTDGTPAEFAHERTETDAIRLEGGVPPVGRKWLSDAIAHGRAVDAERQRRLAFDEVVQGRPSERSLAQIQKMRDPQKGS